MMWRLTKVKNYIFVVVRCGATVLLPLLDNGVANAAEKFDAEPWPVAVVTPVGRESSSKDLVVDSARQQRPQISHKSAQPRAVARKEVVEAKATIAKIKPRAPDALPAPRSSEIETGSVDGVNAVVTRSPADPATVPIFDAAGPTDKSSTVGRFCINIKPQVEEMRIAFQKKSLAEVEVELEKRISLLDAKIKEYRQWQERRQEFSSKAHDALVKIYTKMRPDAAAQQLAVADIETAAAVVLKLDPRVSSAILNDMDPKLAAALASTIAGAARQDDVPPKPTATAP